MFSALGALLHSVVFDLICLKIFKFHFEEHFSIQLFTCLRLLGEQVRVSQRVQIVLFFVRGTVWLFLASLFFFSSLQTARDKIHIS